MGMGKIEFIESYIKVESEYQYNDNHGELIRCGNCTMFDDRTGHCINPRFADAVLRGDRPLPTVRELFYCADGKRRATE